MKSIEIINENQNYFGLDPNGFQSIVCVLWFYMIRFVVFLNRFFFFFFSPLGWFRFQHSIDFWTMDEGRVI